MTKAKRFSKAVLRDNLQKEIDRIQNKYNFDTRSGTIQLEGQSIDKIIAYGRKEALIRLADEFDLYE